MLGRWVEGQNATQSADADIYVLSAIILCAHFVSIFNVVILRVLY